MKEHSKTKPPRGGGSESRVSKTDSGYPRDFFRSKSDRDGFSRSGSGQSCEGTLGLYGTIPLKTIWSRLPYVMVARWDFYGTIG